MKKDFEMSRPFHRFGTFLLKNHKEGMKRENYQDPFNEHVVVLLDELWPTEHETTEELHGRLSHTGGVVHEATMNPALHIQLRNTR